MNTSRIIATAVLVGVWIGHSAVPPAAPDQYLAYVVKKGETLSLICIDFYGHYNGSMGDAVLKLNPGMKDVNLIYVGQELKLRNPAYKAQGPSATAVVLEKKVNATQGVVTYVQGRAVLSPVKTSAKRNLTANTVVEPGDVIETGSDGRVELIINRESVVRMRENSRLVVSALRDNAKKKGETTVRFSLGTVWAKVRKFADKVSRFQMELPTAVAGVHGTVYQGSVARDSSAEVRVYDGEVAVKGKPQPPSEVPGAVSEVPGPQEVPGPHEVSMEEWTQIVRSMQRISIDKNGAPSQPESFKKAADDWEKWNEERDKRIAEMFGREF